MHSDKVTKAYEHIRETNPHITDKRLIELLTRDSIIRKKHRISGLLFFGGFFAYFLAVNIISLFDNESFIFSFLSCLQIIGLLAVLCGILKFCKDLHSPLTPNESRELADSDAVEKGGRNDINLGEYDNSAYIEYKKAEYEKAPPFRKIRILFSRINFFIKLLLFVFLLGGLISTTAGIRNIATYEKRNKNAVCVEARIVYVQEKEDSDGDIKYDYTYSYTYNGQTYSHTDKNIYAEYNIGHTKNLLIDSTNPETIIVNNGNTNLIIGVCAIGAGILLLIYSLLKARDIESGFTVFSLFWLLFAIGATGFAIWGISILISGSMIGLLPLLAGTPVFALGAVLFYKFFNNKT